MIWFASDQQWLQDIAAIGWEIPQHIASVISDFFLYRSNKFNITYLMGRGAGWEILLSMVRVKLDVSQSFC